ncbi:MAG: Histidine kinase protein [Bacteroidota bacterium]|nr:Histidine kinase protein [Bacteroidota bacterium]
MKTVVLIILFAFSINLRAGEIDSLKNLLKKSEPKKRVEILGELGRIYIQINPQQSVEYLRESYKLADESDYRAAFGNIMIYYSQAYNALGKIDSSLQALIEAGKIFENRKDTSNIALYYMTIGDFYYNRGIFELAAKNFTSALRLYDNYLKNNKTTEIIEYNYAVIYNSMSQLCMKLNNIEDGKRYILKAIKKFEELRDSNAIALTQSALGCIYSDEKKYDSALHYQQKGLNLIQKTFYIQSIAAITSNLANCYYKSGDYRKATDLYLKAIDIEKENNYIEGLAETYMNFAEILFKQKKYAEAQDYLAKSLRFAKNNMLNSTLVGVYKLLSECCEKTGDYNSGLQYYKNYSDLNDSLYNSEKIQQVEILKIVYETEKKEEEIKNLKKENELKNLQTTSLIVGILLVLIILLIFYIAFRYYKKTNKILSAKNLEIEYANKELSVKNQRISDQVVELDSLVADLRDKNWMITSQNEQLEKSEKELIEANTTKNKFFSIIAHDLKNPIHALVMSIEVLINHYNKLSKEQLQDYVGNVHKTSKNLVSFIEHLLQWARTQTDKIEFKPEHYDISSIADENIDILSEAAYRKKITCINEIPSDTFVSIDRNMISSVFRNLISNSIKFTNNGGKIKISCRHELSSNELIASIEDSGIGMTKEVMENLFRLDVTYTNSGTDNEEGSGLGLILCKEFVEKHVGRIWVESEPGKGSRFSFSLQIHKAKKF